MKKRSLLMAASLVLALLVATTGTLAFLQDTDSDHNVMTLGSVTIEQHEYERVVNADGSYKTDTIDEQTSYVLQGFTQLKPLVPIVGDPNEPGDSPLYAGWDDTTVRMTQVDSYGGMDVFAGKNAQDKFVTVENTGASPAYVRTLVAIEVGSTKGEMIGTSYHQTWKPTDNDDSTPDIAEPLYITIDGVGYMVIEYTYEGAPGVRHENGILPGHDTTYPSLSQVYIKSVATNEDLVAIDGNKNGWLDIIVISQAIQADGFEDAKTALDTGFGAPTGDNDNDKTINVVEWLGGVALITPASNGDELVEALEGGNDVVFTDDIDINPASMSNAYGTTGINVKNGQMIDGNGHTLDIAGAGGTWDSGINTTGGVIKNLTVTGSFRGIFINHNSDHSEKVVLENVTIEGTTYTISCDQGLNQNLEATNSTFNGWTSYAATLGEAKFVNCKFGEGNGYAYCRPYAPTEFVGCEFEAGYVVDPRAAVTFENCTIGGVALTAANVSDLVTDTAKVTVK